jgi:hypothetical protein
MSAAPPPPAAALTLISSGSQHLSLRSSAWAVVCVTLKLAKVLPADRCLELMSGGSLSVLEQQKVRQHLEVVVLPALEPGDFLLSDLSISDEDPARALLPGDPRCGEYVERATLEQLVGFIHESRGAASVRRLQWAHPSARPAHPHHPHRSQDILALSARHALKKNAPR